MKLLAHIKDVVQGKAKLGQKRSARWPAVRKAHLMLHPFCAVCGGREKLQVHHLQVFHLHPELELEPTNLVTACEAPDRQCHLKICHGGNFRAVVPDTMTLVERMREALKEQTATLLKARTTRQGA